MKRFDVSAGAERRRRFRRPEFQQKLRAARSFERKTPPRPTGFWQGLLRSIGLHTPWRQLSVLLGFGIIAYFSFFSSVFLISKVEVGEGGFSAEQLSEIVAGMRDRRVYLVPSNHLLLINRDSVLRALQTEIPQIRSVTSFSRTGLGSIRLGLEERESKYVWQSGEDYFLLDQDGVVFQRVLNYDPPVYPELLLVDRSAQPVVVGDNVDAGRLMELVTELVALWPDVVAQTSYQSFSFPGVASLDIFVRTGIGFQVYIDVERSVTAQLRSLNLLLTREIKPETYAGLSYIDLRLPDVAYYCYKDAPCAPENATSTQAIIP
ncbi:MAG: hypothetical protein UY73_C0017G0005 [Parcubacteria group bacterium GW2011_GWA2_52_8]|nr:MAG: hypothetical protein UY73_C0017G0005 [Parcubacteria group bacterium GW2011_GWA2_52_8]